MHAKIRGVFLSKIVLEIPQYSIFQCVLVATFIICNRIKLLFRIWNVQVQFPDRITIKFFGQTDLPTAKIRKLYRFIFYWNFGIFILEEFVVFQQNITSNFFNWKTKMNLNYDLFSSPRIYNKIRIHIRQLKIIFQ